MLLDLGNQQKKTRDMGLGCSLVHSLHEGRACGQEPCAVLGGCGNGGVRKDEG